MAFLDLTIKLTDGKRFRAADRINQNSTDFKSSNIHDDCPDDTIPITSVANILAKLSGHRPWKRNDIELGKVPISFSRFMNMANRSRVEIFTVGGNKELMRSSKASHSGTKQTWKLRLDGNLFSMVRNLPTYETIQAVLPDVDWKTLEAMLINLFGSDYRTNLASGATSAAAMIENLRKEYVRGNKEVIAFCEYYKNTSTKLRDLLIVPLTTGSPVRDGKKYKVFRIDSPIGKTSVERLLHNKTNTHGILMAQVVSGVLHVKIAESELDMFRNGPGFATFLDGGVAEIGTLDLDYWQSETDSLPNPFISKTTKQE